MNSEKPDESTNRRPIDWIAWSIWIVLFAVIGISGFLIRQRSLSHIEVWMPVKDLPAYHLIVDSEVMKTTQAVSSLPANVLSANTSPIGAYTIQTVNNSDVLSQDDVVIPSDPQLTVDTVPISIPSTATMLYNGKLDSGSIVDVWLVQSLKVNRSAKSELILQHAFVLDVQQVQNAAGNENYPYAIILAVSIDRRADILSATANGSLLFTLYP